MLNSYARAYNNLNISATSGTLIKSHPKSFTSVYEINSTFANRVHGKEPVIVVDNYNRKDCVVIQTMVIGSNLLMSEIVWLEDYLDVEGK